MSKNVWIITDLKMEEAEARKMIAETSTWNINQIESLPETAARLMADSHEVIKGHDVYFIDFGGYFKYSYVVYLRGKHLRYAGDYELHHPNKTREQLYKWYKSCLNKKLYTERGLGNKLKNYNDYRRRTDYLRDYYVDLENHVSIFGNGGDAEYVEEYKRVTANLIYSDIGFAYYESADFVNKCNELYDKIEAARKAMDDNFDYWKKAFHYEFANYECIYGGRYDEAAIAATNGTKLNDIQKAAYKAAKNEYIEWCYAHDLP